MKKSKNAIIRLLSKSVKYIVVILVLGLVIYNVKWKPMAVEVYTVQKGAITDEVMGSGALDARVKMMISSRISGRIEEVLVDQGDVVKRDQVVVILDDDLLKQDIRVAEASLETAKSSMKKVQSELEIEQAILGNAIKTYNRQKSLISTGATSQTLYDKASESLETSQARVNRAKIAVVEGENKISEASQLLILRRAQLDDTRLRALFDGKVTKRELDPGNIVIPGASVLTLVSTDVLWVRAWVDEAALAKIRLGLPADIVFRSEPKKRYAGKVARIASEVDSETREFIVDVYVDSLPKNWAIGQRAEVYIKASEKKSVLMVPEKMIAWKDNHSGVFVQKEGVAVWTLIKVGVHGRGFIEILEGVNEGDKVVLPVNPKKKLQNNVRIEGV